MQAHKSDTSSATLQAMSENHDHAINGLRVLAKIIARHHANRSLQVNKNPIHDNNSKGG